MKAIVVEVPLVKGKQRDAVREVQGLDSISLRFVIYSTIDKEAMEMH